MNLKKEQPTNFNKNSTKKEQRERKLQAALRKNLLRRKTKSKDQDN